MGNWALAYLWGRCGEAGKNGLKIVDLYYSLMAATRSARFGRQQPQFAAWQHKGNLNQWNLSPMHLPALAKRVRRCRLDKSWRDKKLAWQWRV